MGWLILSGVLCACAFPPVGWQPLLLVAPALALWRLYGASWTQAAWGAFWWGSGYWVVLSLPALPVFQQGASEWMGGVAWVLALLWMLGWWTLFGALLGWLRVEGWRWGVVLACLWTVMNWARSLGALGFPWGMFTNGLAETPFLLLPASLGGVWLVEWLILAWNGALALALRGDWRTASVLGGLIALSWLGYSVGYQLWMPSPKGALMVGVTHLAPTSVYSRQIENERYESLIRAAAGRGAQWVVFPEATESCSESEGTADWCGQRWQQWGAQYSVTLLVGARISHPAGRVVFNSALAYAPERSPLRYDKVKLMAFTEWVPPAPLRGLIRMLGVRGESFQAGQQLQPLRIDREAPVGGLICVESLFGWTARAHVREGAQWLCLMTAESSLENALVRRQYAAFTSLRAIETGRWVARTAYNGGEIGFYGPLGERLVQQPHATVVITGTIGLYTHQTPYVRFGDWWIYGCTVAISALIWRRSRQPRQSVPLFRKRNCALLS